MEQTSSVSPDVRARILAANERLYDEMGRGDKYPSISDVRNEARADMNACSAVLKEWRRQQTAKPAPVPVTVPDHVMQAHLEATAIVWAAAQEQANASLRDAEAKWETERRDGEVMRQELAQAFEAASQDAEEANERCAQSRRVQDELQQQVRALTDQLGAAREALATQTARADANEGRVNDLKTELQLAHAETAEVRHELSQARQSHLAELETHKKAASEQLAATSERLASANTRLELATEQLDTRTDELRQIHVQLATAQAQRDELQRSHTALQAEHDRVKREADAGSRELAKSGGVLQEVMRQNAEFLARLEPAAPNAPKKPARRPASGRRGEPTADD